MSERFEVRFLEPEFLATYAEPGYRRFADDDQAREYFAEREGWAERSFLAGIPDMKALAQQPSVGPYHAFIPFTPIEGPADIAAIKVFPANVRLPAGKTQSLGRSVELTLVKPLKDAEAHALWDLAENLPARTSAEIQEKFTRPSVTGAGKFFALYLGSTAHCRAAAAAHWEKILRARWERVFKALETRFPDADALRRETRFKDPRPLHEKSTAPLTAADFNPHGPLLDDRWRARADRGQMAAIVLFTPAKALRDEQPPVEFNTWLAGLLAAPEK